MLNVRIAADHLYGKLLYTWPSLVMSLLVSYFVLSLFPRDVLDEIWDLIESVSDGFPTYFRILEQILFCNSSRKGRITIQIKFILLKNWSDLSHFLRVFLSTFL